MLGQESILDVRQKAIEKTYETIEKIRKDIESNTLEVYEEICEQLRNKAEKNIILSTVEEKVKLSQNPTRMRTSFEYNWKINESTTKIIWEILDTKDLFIATNRNIIISLSKLQNLLKINSIPYNPIKLDYETVELATKLTLPTYPITKEEHLPKPKKINFEELQRNLMNFSKSMEEIKITYPYDYQRIIENPEIERIISIQNQVREMPNWIEMTICDSKNVMVVFEDSTKKQGLAHFQMNQENQLECVGFFSISEHYHVQEQFRVMREEHVYFVTEDGYITAFYDYLNQIYVDLEEKIDLHSKSALEDVRKKINENINATYKRKVLRSI